MKIGFVSFRIAGTDGVSLEAEGWKAILTRMGHEVTFIAGELDQPGILVPSMHFTHPEVYRVHQMVVENNINYRKVEKDIFALAGGIEGELRQVFRRYKFDRLIVANVFSLPIHFPLAVALERVIMEFEIPTVARNHDFWWERQRYLKSHCFEFFERWFPPKHESISYVTINTIAQKELRRRTGLDSVVIGDSFDFESSLNKGDGYSRKWRKDFGLTDQDIVFLQATRIVPRKGIELSIELVKRLNDPRAILILAGYAGDESGDYLEKLKSLARDSEIRHKFIGDRVDSQRKIKNKRRGYTLWDCFVNCDFMTYPSVTEGFGNQFVEAVYFKKPIFVNRYPVYKADIEPLRFDAVTIDSVVTDEAVKKIREWMNSPETVKRVVEKNFEIGKKNFSFEVMEVKLKTLVI